MYLTQWVAGGAAPGEGAHLEIPGPSKSLSHSLESAARLGRHRTAGTRGTRVGFAPRCGRRWGEGQDALPVIRRVRGGGTATRGEHMHVQTTRFGSVEVGEDRLIDFPTGLLGFSSFTRFALLQPDEDGVFYWLQSVDSPDLAFVVTDPSRWCDTYEASVRREHMDLLDLEQVDDARVFVIVNKYDDTLTANLQGPLVVNLRNRRGIQIVLSDQRWTTRWEIARLQQPAVPQRVSA